MRPALVDARMRLLPDYGTPPDRDPRNQDEEHEEHEHASVQYESPIGLRSGLQSAKRVSTGNGYLCKFWLN